MSPQPARHVIEAFTVATLAPAIAFAIGQWHWTWFIPAFYYAAAHTLALGVPAYLILRYRGWVNLPTAMIAGIVIGMIPVSVWTWPGWFGRDPTAYEWRQYASSVCLFGAFGGIAGFAFSAHLWLRKRMSPNSGMQPTPTSGAADAGR